MPSVSRIEILFCFRVFGERNWISSSRRRGTSTQVRIVQSSPLVRTSTSSECHVRVCFCSITFFTSLCNNSERKTQMHQMHTRNDEVDSGGGGVENQMFQCKNTYISRKKSFPHCIRAHRRTQTELVHENFSPPSICVAVYDIQNIEKTKKAWRNRGNIFRNFHVAKNVSFHRWIISFHTMCSN